jgi:hypothetical protein
MGTFFVKDGGVKGPCRVLYPILETKFDDVALKIDGY